MSAPESYDVVIVGSGAAGATAALRAAELGLSVLVVEKAHKYGGTSASSGGVLWIPNHQIVPSDDSRSSALAYIRSLIKTPVQQDRLEAYVDQGPEMVRFLNGLGVGIAPSVWPDYYPEMPGARADRSLVCDTFDGATLGDRFTTMREQYTRFKLLNRYAMDLPEFFSISTRGKGWIRAFLKILVRYWTDFGVRRRTRRDRRFTSGAALMGRIYKRVFDRGVEVRLETRLEELIVEDGVVRGVKVSHFGRPYTIQAKHGVVLAAGGFEWNQELREKFFPVPGSVRHSSTPENANTGDALKAGMAIGAATEHTEGGWWIPTMHMPMPKVSNFEEIHQAAFDVGRPHSVCVNRNGVRFVDEACSYDEFGNAMVRDAVATGANAPCWLVFDATFRQRYTAGGFMPTAIMPDWRIPPDYWDHYIFRADTVEALARKIRVPVDALTRTVGNMNQYAKSGTDPEFNRGGTPYDRMFGDATVTPNPCLGAIATAPFYAVSINLGDLGTKGGLKADAHARVLDRNNRPIPNLYAAGNNAGSPFGQLYPGAGGTIGPAMTFGFVAVNDIAARAGKAAAAAAKVLEAA